MKKNNKLIDVIRSVKNINVLVARTIRKHGFVNDTWSINYHDNDEDIPKGYIKVYDINDESFFLVKEKLYHETLAQICEKDGYQERAELIHKFIQNPNYVDNLLEANPAKCNERWNKFAPFLVKYGWIIEEEYIKFPTTDQFYNLSYIESDLDVLYRELLKQQDNSSSQTSQLKALESFFAYEKGLISS